MVGNASTATATAVFATMALHAALVPSSGLGAAAAASTEPDAAPAAPNGLRRRRRRWSHERRAAAAIDHADSSAADDGSGRHLAQCQWHADMTTQDGCSNDDNYPEEWTAPDLRSMMFFADAAACCAAFFGGPDCPTYDRGCAAGAGGGGGGGGDGGAGGGAGGASSDCAWHADMETGMGCSNDDTYPPDWLDPKVKHMMFFPTSAECCQMVLGPSGECATYDRGCSSNVLADGGGAGNAPTTNDGGVTAGGGSCTTNIAGWHADMTHRDGCSDDANYPADWLASPQMFYPTAADCCAYFQGSLGPSCKIYNHGCPIDPHLATGGCNDKVWHPDVSTGARGGLCSNAKNYPSEWNREKGWTFGSATECCASHRKGGKCGAKDGCTGEVVQVVDTPKPTPRPTPRPTKPPTPQPTHEPSMAPTPRPARFYLKFGTTTCISDKDEPRPHYIANDYLDMLTCCVASLPDWQQRECIDAIPADAYEHSWEEDAGPTPVPAPTTPAPTDTPTETPEVFYVQHGTGTCVDAEIVAPPYYVTETYPSIVKCCRASFASEVCFLAADEAGYYVGPTPAPSPAPVPDVFVELSMEGSMEMEHMGGPGEYGAEMLRGVFVNAIAKVMVQSPICHPDIAVVLTTWAGEAFRRLEAEDRATRDAPAGLGGGGAQRRAAAKTLQFEMTVHAVCDGECQAARGPRGKLAFNELAEHFAHYIDSGAMTSMLHIVAAEWGLLVDNGEDDPSPVVIAGSLTYGSGAKSDVTWVPTSSPTASVPSKAPTSSPTTSPTTAAPSTAPTTDAPTPAPTTTCATFRWHYAGDRGCTNDQDYPLLWKQDPEVGSYFLFDTLEECCAANSPVRCVVTDVCDEVYTPKACVDGDFLFHPTTPEQSVCANGGNHPPGWTVGNGFLFDYSWNCCASYYGNTLCLIKNVCY